MVHRTRRQQVAQAQHRAEQSGPGLLHASAAGRQLTNGAVQAAQGGDRVRRVIGKLACGFIRGRHLRSQPAITPQEVAGRHSAGQRPGLFVPPAAAVVELAQGRLAARAATHHKDLHGRLIRRLPSGIVGQPARKVRQLFFKVPVHTPHALRPEVDLVAIAGLASHANMAPGADDQAHR